MRYVFSPLISAFFLAITSIFAFSTRHPLSGGILSFVIAAIYEASHATAAYLQMISSKQVAAKERWQKDVGIDMKE